MGNHEQLLQYIIEGLQDKKAKKIVNIDLSKLGFAPCDNFIICHGDSGTQVRSLSDSVEERVVNTLQVAINHREGLQNASWVLLDFGNVVVHIFQRETREYYKLEDLWGDAEITFIKED